MVPSYCVDGGGKSGTYDPSGTSFGRLVVSALAERPVVPRIWGRGGCNLADTQAAARVEYTYTAPKIRRCYAWLEMF